MTQQIINNTLIILPESCITEVNSIELVLPNVNEFDFVYGEPNMVDMYLPSLTRESLFFLIDAEKFGIDSVVSTIDLQDETVILSGISGKISSITKVIEMNREACFRIEFESLILIDKHRNMDQPAPYYIEHAINQERYLLLYS
jgi:hypothetical protein